MIDSNNIEFLWFYFETQMYSLYYFFYDLFTGSNSLKKLLKVFSLDLLCTKPRKHVDSENLHQNKHFVYLCNHVSYTDFFLDGYLTNGSCYIARMMVMFAIPFSCLFSYFHNGIIFIATKRKNTKQDLISKMKKRIVKNSIVLYPEGKRNLSGKIIPIKLTAVEFAYENQIPVQLVISSNKDVSFNEKKWKINKNVPILVYYSKVFNSINYKSYDDYSNEILKEWNRIYTLILKNDFRGSTDIQM
jgi:1-acyl-sn-glycerol-3-phosphate acyltransferase